MKFISSNHINLENVPGGSGIVKAGHGYHVIGDDSLFLFTLNKEFQVVSKTPLVDSFGFSDERIKKSQKPDFESFEMAGEKKLVVFGSGSKSPQ